MKIFNKQKLFSSSTLILSLVVFTFGVFSPKYVFHPTIAAVERQNFFSTNNSVSVLPDNLALNKTQKQNITKINRRLSQEIQTILTQEQLQQLLTELSNGLALLPVLSNLALTPEQKKQLQTALYSAQIRIKRVLTPQQLKYIRQR